MSMILETVGVGVGIVGLGVAIKEYFDGRKKKSPTPEDSGPELTTKQKHAKMHELIERHKEMCQRINENHELIHKLKATPGMGKQKGYVWSEISADKDIRNGLVEQIKELKIELFGDRAVNI